ncbi:MAG: flavoprotein [SAR324 cluster bacterium]|uniref:Flavoprotein n=1 Tax=SAR324 cluster bacterium TaxID=2024889 RepID=A0A2A4T8J7_9DELT|nr:MAG: flavoprotein [SAR324 cluster bacterium]
MKSEIIFNERGHRWVVLGRDPQKPEQIIDTNEHFIIHDDQALLMDPGGTEIFPQVLSEITRYVKIENITTIVASHQDPDIVSSLALWLDLCPHVKVYCPKLWVGFIAHFGMGTKMELIPIPDNGLSIPLGTTKASIYAVPAHYCHSSGNFSFFDPISNFLFSGDIGAALLPADESNLFIQNFQSHIQYMEGFHQRWMPSQAALRAWTRRVRMIQPDLICPQHGSIFKQNQIDEFLGWLEKLEVGLWKGDDQEQELSMETWMQWKHI